MVCRHPGVPVVIAAAVSNSLKKGRKGLGVILADILYSRADNCVLSLVHMGSWKMPAVWVEERGENMADAMFS